MDNREYVKALKNYPMALKVAEVAEILRISQALVYRLIKEEKIASVKIGRENRIAKTELICYMRTGKSCFSDTKTQLAPKTSDNSWTSEKLCGICVVAANK